MAAEDVEEGGILSIFGVTNKTANKIYIVMGVVFALLVLAFAVLLVIRRRNKKKARQRRAELAMKIAMEREMQRVYENKKRYMR